MHRNENHGRNYINFEKSIKLYIHKLFLLLLFTMIIVTTIITFICVVACVWLPLLFSRILRRVSSSSRLTTPGSASS